MGLHIKQKCPRVKRVFIEAEAWSALTAIHQNN
jgi:phage FluMu protein Com